LLIAIEMVNVHGVIVPQLNSTATTAQTFSVEMVRIHLHPCVTHGDTAEHGRTQGRIQVSVRGSEVQL